MSLQGETTVQTKGYAGADCLAASAFLERALGMTVNDIRTDEFYQPTTLTQEAAAHGISIRIDIGNGLPFLQKCVNGKPVAFPPQRGHPDGL